MTADRDDLAAKPFSRVGEHDANDLNQLAEVISQAIEAASPTRFVLLDERYGAAVAVLESDWLRDVKADVWKEARMAVLSGFVPESEHEFLSLYPNPYRADRVDAEDGGGE